MPAKNGNQPQPIRYLLSADPTLKKLSLRRISVRVKNGKKLPRSIRSKEPGHAKKFMRFPWAVNTRAIVLAVICVMAAAALIAARQPSRRPGVSTVGTGPEVNAQPEKLATARPDTKTMIAPKAPAVAAAARTHGADATLGSMPPVESVKAPAVESTANARSLEPVPKVPAVESTTKADLEKSVPVTITGCLELDEETFWLKDAAGVDAPKSRSWRSGFLKRRSSQIELVDAANTLKLPNYVGQRVAATGTLMNRGMRARSLQRVAISCG